MPNPSSPCTKRGGSSGSDSRPVSKLSTSAEKPPVPTKAAEPVLSRTFDPWNSSATGHQRAENRLGGSTGWRDSRNSKLMSQYASRGTGGLRMSDTVGAGSNDFDPATQQLVRPEARFRATNSVLSMLKKPGSMKSAGDAYESLRSSASGLGLGSGSAVLAGTRSCYHSSPSLGSALYSVDAGRIHEYQEVAEDSMLLRVQQPSMIAEETTAAKRQADDKEGAARQAAASRPALFAGVVVYVNGSTHPHISDHKLKQLLAEHGGSMSMHLGRRKVTHVILGKPSVSSLSGSRGGGAGGGLAGGKLQREIQQVGGCAVKYIGVEWVLESIKAGKRLPEARFSNLKVASRGQKSVYGLASRPPSEVANDMAPPPSGQRQA